MAGQGIERRDILKMLATASLASGFPGFSRWSFACQHHSETAVQIKPDHYQPRFFTAEEYAVIEQLADLIIPSDGTPGAREAGVSEFIDFMAWSDSTIQYRFRFGIIWLDALSRSRHGSAWTDLEPDKQAEILQGLAYPASFRPGEEDGRSFFRLFRDYTVMGFYTTRIGLEELDYPGLKLYAESPACPHPNDPEHRSLKEPSP
jgi:gluconate 2-dehydrogenase gamma chain